MTESRISGTLKNVSGYTGFSGREDLQSGHYLALKFEADEGATTTIQLIGALETPNPITLDEDMNCVLRITDPATQKLKVVSTLEDHQTVEKIYTLRGLVLSDSQN